MAPAELDRPRWWWWWRRLRDDVTIEPVVACYMTAYTMITLTVANLNLLKACKVNLRLPDDRCDALMGGGGGADGGAEAAVQRLVAGMQLWQTCVQNAAPCLLVLLAGSWSDRTRRRVPCLLLPLFGELLRNAGQAACVYYFGELPMEAAGLAETVPIALTGGQVMMTMTAYSYVGDATSTEARTFKIGKVNAVMAISMAVGTSLSGVVYLTLGFYGAYGLSSILLVVGILYGLFCVEDIVTESASDKNRPVCTTVLEFFDLKHVTRSLYTTFKKRPGNQRLKIIILLFILMTSSGTNYGFRTVSYLYTRIRFNWDEIDYSFYATYELLINISGLLLTIYVLGKKLKISDEIIGVMSTTSQSLAALFFFFAYNALLFFIGPLVNILASSENVSIKSLMTKLVPKTEISQIAAIFSIAETLVSIVFGLLYNGLYEITLNTLPGAFYIITLVVMAPSIALFLWMYVERKRDGGQSYDVLGSEESLTRKFKSVEPSDYGTMEKS